MCHTLGFQVNALLKEANNAVHTGSDKNGKPYTQSRDEYHHSTDCILFKGIVEIIQQARI
jgi:hypothetical protein